MIKFIISSALYKLRLFFSNKSNNELISKIYVKNIFDKIIQSKKITYLLDGFKVYSQNDEDGIIESIFSDIGTTNKLFVEIGVGKDGIENNTHYLLLKNWRGLWIEANSNYVKAIKKNLPFSNQHLDLLMSSITPDNINRIVNDFVKKYKKKNDKMPFEIDFLSIDIDSNDICCLKALNKIRPRLICIEYNAKFPPNIDISIDNKRQIYQWNYDDYFGSSLSYIEKEMKKINYKLISTNIAGTNAFFTLKKLYSRCKTQGQTINDLYMPANYNLFDYYITHRPTNKYLNDKLKKKN